MIQRKLLELSQHTLCVAHPERSGERIECLRDQFGTGPGKRDGLCEEDSLSLRPVSVRRTCLATAAEREWGDLDGDERGCGCDCTRPPDSSDQNGPPHGWKRRRRANGQVALRGICVAYLRRTARHRGRCAGRRDDLAGVGRCGPGISGRGTPSRTASKPLMPARGHEAWILSACERHVAIDTVDGCLDLRRDDRIRVGKPRCQIRRGQNGCGAEDAPPSPSLPCRHECLPHAYGVGSVLDRAPHPVAAETDLPTTDAAA